MRLLFLTNLYPPHHLGGLELHCQEVTARLITREQSVSVLTSRYGQYADWDEHTHIARKLFLQNDPYYYHPANFFLRRPWQERKNLQVLKQALAEVQPDVLLVWGMWNLTHWLPYWAEQWLPGRVAYMIASYWPTDQDMDVEYWRSSANRSMTELIKRPLRALALQRLQKRDYAPRLKFEHVACCSQYVRDSLVQAGVFSESAQVIYPGVEPAPFLKNSVSQRHAQPNRVRLLYFGSLFPHKGVHTAITALNLLKERGLSDRLELTILGSGHPGYEATLRNLINEYQLASKIHFLPSVPRTQIPTLLSGFDVFLSTSTWPEPFARTNLEAMLAGLLVIGSEVGGNTEVLFHGENSLTFQPSDASGLADQIARVVVQPELRQRLAQAGRATVLQRFTLDQHIDQIEQWLKSIVT